MPQDTSNAQGPHDALAWIDAQRDAMMQKVRGWCAINTGTYNVPGLRRFADVLTVEIQRITADLPIERLDVATHELIGDDGKITKHLLGPALRCSRPAAAGTTNTPRVLLNIHADTVYAADHPFQSVTQPDHNTLVGPGVADAKGGLVVMLTALEAFLRSPDRDRLTIELLINPDEEIGSPGSAPLLAAAAKRNDVGLLFEPALPDGSLVASRKGSGNFTIVVHGRAAHAGRDFERGRNAIVALAGLIQDFTKPGAAPPHATVNIGRIVGGGPPNIVPDLAIAHINARVTSSGDQQAIEKLFTATVTQLNHHDGFCAELHGGFRSPPKPRDARTRHLQELFNQCARNLRMTISWGDSGGAGDGNRLAAAGLPNIDSLGPRGGDLHSPTEFLRIDSLAERAKLTYEFLRALATGQIKLNGG